MKILVAKEAARSHTGSTTYVRIDNISEVPRKTTLPPRRRHLPTAMLFFEIWTTLYLAISSSLSRRHREKHPHARISSEDRDEAEEEEEEDEDEEDEDEEEAA